MDKSSTEIICAAATPEGTSALSIIRLSGRGSLEMIEGLMMLEKERLKGMRRIVGPIIDGKTIVDEVVAISWPEGRSFTGEEMVEIICHGIPSSIRQIMELLVRSGARRAEPGEFSKRAFSTGRMNALQVIALAASWDRNDGNPNASGKTLEICTNLLKTMQEAIEALEGHIEFGEMHLIDTDEDVSGMLGELLDRSNKFRDAAAAAEKRIRIMIMGPANSGKSTLFNMLAGEGTALVSDEPGTTRDGASGIVDILGRRVHLCDTAGTDGTGLDGIAFKSVIASLNGTEKVIWMSEGGRTPPTEDVRNRAGQVIEIAGKSDLYPDDKGNHILRVSSKSGEGITKLKREVIELHGSMSITGTAERIYRNSREALESIESGEFGIAAEILKEMELEMRGILGKGENIILSVERALAGMCVGK